MEDNPNNLVWEDKYIMGATVYQAREDYEVQLQHVDLLKKRSSVESDFLCRNFKQNIFSKPKIFYL